VSTTTSRVAALGAFVALVVGMVVAASLQPAGYSSTRSTISDLAADGAQDRWVMTTAFLVTAGALGTVAATAQRFGRAARQWLALAAVGVVIVALFPLPGGAFWHGIGALAAFGALAVWPLAVPRERRSDWPLRSATTGAYAVVALLLLVALNTASGIGVVEGLAERVLAAGELAWLVAATFAGGRRRVAPRAAS
jgi:hypothetical membrane protein